MAANIVVLGLSVKLLVFGVRFSFYHSALIDEHAASLLLIGVFEQRWVENNRNKPTTEDKEFVNEYLGHIRYTSLRRFRALLQRQAPVRRS